MTMLRMPGATNAGRELLDSALAQLDRAAKRSAALEGQITPENAGEIRAPIIV